MIPTSLSASSLQVYETCSARWKAEYLDRARGLAGDPANLGTAVHAVLERWVAQNFYRANVQAPMSYTNECVQALWDEEYSKLFDDQRRYAEGLQLCLGWVHRQDWSGRTVLTTETKKEIPLPTSIGPIPLRFVCDRVDRLDNGEIEVVDYKTLIRPVQPDDLRKRLQARLYSMAARTLYPDAPRIWVTFDLIRYDSVGVVFTRDDDVATWSYIKSLAERIIADDGTGETMNTDCRYCVRRFNCESLTSHLAAGGPLGITDGHDAADRRLTLDAAAKALRGMVDELDTVILEHCEREGLTNFVTDNGTAVKIGAKKTRSIDSAMAARVVGPELVAQHGKLGVTVVDQLLKEKTLTDEQKAGLRALIRSQYGNPSVSTDRVGGLE